MSTNFIITTDSRGIPQQNFNGKVYRLYRGERYFSRGTKRMHVVVWETYNGRVPAGYDVHHINENTHDNTPGNLEIRTRQEHLSEHTKKRFAENKEWAKKFQEAGIKAAPEWHKSEEGKIWHSQHAINNTAHVHEKNIATVCDCCGESYMTSIFKESKQRFCSNKCKSKWRRHQGLDNIEKQCPKCGKTFQTSKYKPTMHCSISCGKKK